MRITDAVLGATDRYGAGAPTLNLEYGGQMGFMPRIGTVGIDGKNYEEWISNAAYIRRNLIPILLTYPRFFDLMPYTSTWIRTLKAVMEQHPLKIEGLKQSITVETDNHPVGGAGEIQEEYTNVTRDPSTPSFSWQEKSGEAIARFWEWYITNGMMDPDTKIANVKTYATDDNYNGLYTPDFYTFSMMFIEPDALGKKANRAWLCCNMFPKGSITVEGSRDIRQAGELKEISLEFSQLGCPPSVALMNMAKALLSAMNSLKKVPLYDFVLPHSGINSSVAAQNSGIDS